MLEYGGAWYETRYLRSRNSRRHLPWSTGDRSVKIISVITSSTEGTSGMDRSQPYLSLIHIYSVIFHKNSQYHFTTLTMSSRTLSTLSYTSATVKFCIKKIWHSTNLVFSTILAIHSERILLIQNYSEMLLQKKLTTNSTNLINH